MSYFDRREDESVRYCAVCERRTMHTRPSPIAIWTCKDSGHPHPTKHQQELGMMTNDNFESEIRHAVGLCLKREHEGERVLRPVAGLIGAIKDMWRNHRHYPTNARIAEVMEAMEREGTIVLRIGDYGHEEGPRFYSWPGTELIGDGADEWEPVGERLRVDRRGYSPRQTQDEILAFRQDRERLPRYDHESGTYLRDDLPRVFECGCTWEQVLGGRCDTYGPDGRERGWRSE